MADKLITLAQMKVKVDISFMEDGRIRLHPHLVKRYDVRVGDGIEIMQYGVETLLRIVKNPNDDMYEGFLYSANKGSTMLQTRNVAMARLFVKDGERCCSFRCGQPIVINGIDFIPIITRRNYYRNGNTTSTT